MDLLFFALFYFYCVVGWLLETKSSKVETELTVNGSGEENLNRWL
jgi:hypothetical protein